MLTGINSPGGQAFFVVTLIFIVLDFVAVALRIWAKNIRRRPFEIHDYLMFGALLFATAFAVDDCIAIGAGLVGLHIGVAEKQAPSALTITFKTFFSSVFMWVSATTLVKLSVLHLYIGVFARPTFRRVAYGVGVVCIMFWIAYVCTEFGICQPLDYQWDKTLKDGHCGDTSSQVIAVAVVNTILDLAIVVLPMPIIATLQMPQRKKMMLFGIFSGGLSICAINIIRIGLTARDANSPDFTYTSVESGLLSGLEVYLGVIVGCFPTFGPLLYAEATGGSKQNQSTFRPTYGGKSYGTKSRARPDDPYDRHFDASYQDDVPLKDQLTYSGRSGEQASAWAEASSPSSIVPSGGLANDVVNVRTDMSVKSSRPNGNDMV